MRETLSIRSQSNWLIDEKFWRWNSGQIHSRTQGASSPLKFQTGNWPKQRRVPLHTRKSKVSHPARILSSCPILYIINFVNNPKGSSGIFCQFYTKRISLPPVSNSCLSRPMCNLKLFLAFAFWSQCFFSFCVTTTVIQSCLVLCCSISRRLLRV